MIWLPVVVQMLELDDLLLLQFAPEPDQIFGQTADCGFCVQVAIENRLHCRFVEGRADDAVVAIKLVEAAAFVRVGMLACRALGTQRCVHGMA